MDRDLKIRISLMMSKVNDVIAPLTSLAKQSKRASDALDVTRAKLKQLEKAKSYGDAFADLDKRVLSTRLSLAAAKQKVDELANSYNRSNAPTKRMAASIAAAENKVKKLTDRLADEQKQLTALGDKYGFTGLDSRDFANHQRQLADDIKRTTGAINNQKEALAKMAAAQKRQNSLTRQRDLTRTRASNMAIGGAATVGVGAAMLAPLSGAINVSQEYESVNVDLRQTLGLTAAQVAVLSQKIIALGPLTNRSGKELEQTANQLASFGIAANKIPGVLVPIGRVTTAYKADINDIATASFGLIDGFKVPIDQAARAFDVMAASGKAGGFELPDMAKSFQLIAAGASALGMTGVTAVAQLSAELQALKASTGSSEMAVDALINVMQKFKNEEAQKNFKKHGIDLDAELAAGAKKGLTPLQTVRQQVMKALKGDISRIGELYGDMQVQNYFKGTAPAEREASIAANTRTALGSKNVVNADYVLRMQTAQAATDKLNNSTEILQKTIGDRVSPTLAYAKTKLGEVVDSINQWMKDNPGLADTLITVYTGVAVLLVLLGALAIGAAAILGPFALLRYAVFSTIPAIWGFTAALLANPLTWFALAITLAIAGVVALVVAIHDHWGTISETFKGFGQSMMDGLVNGISGAWTKVKDFVTGVAGKIGDAFKVTLGIHSPSRVFDGYGHNLMAGLANGIAGNTSAPLSRVNDASRAITAALAIGAATASPASAASGRGGPVAGQGTGNVAHIIQNFNIYQQPGESSDALAKRIAAEFDKRDRAHAARQRSSMGDYGE